MEDVLRLFDPTILDHRVHAVLRVEVGDDQFSGDAGASHGRYVARVVNIVTSSTEARKGLSISTVQQRRFVGGLPCP